MGRKKTYGIKAVYDREDERLRRKVEVRCQYVDKGGVVRANTVRVTEAEKWVIESIAMRLFLDHRRVIAKKKDGDRVELTGVVTIG